MRLFSSGAPSKGIFPAGRSTRPRSLSWSKMSSQSRFRQFTREGRFDFTEVRLIWWWRTFFGSSTHVERTASDSQTCSSPSPCRWKEQVEYDSREFCSLNMSGSTRLEPHFYCHQHLQCLIDREGEGSWINWVAIPWPSWHLARHKCPMFRQM